MVSPAAEACAAIERGWVGSSANPKAPKKAITAMAKRVSRSRAALFIAASSGPGSSVYQRAGTPEVLVANGFRRPVRQGPHQTCRVVAIVLRKRVGARCEHIGHVPGLQISIQRGGLRVRTHDGAAAGVRALIA